MMLLVLFVVFIIWAIITLIVVIIAYKMSKNKTTAFVVFMLVMGGWLVYWALELAYLQAKVSYLCNKEARVTVYVTPEEWRKQLGKEEWETLKYDYKDMSEENLTLKFNGKIYYASSQLNKRLISFQAVDTNRDGVFDLDEIFVDKITNQVLFRNRFFAVGASLDDWKQWFNLIHDCRYTNGSYNDVNFDRNYTNY